MKRAQNPFHFVSRINLTECTQWRANSLEELLRHLRAVPSSVIYYHTHHFLRQHQFLSPEPPNDFAYWASEALGEEELGESLSSVDIVRMPSLEDLRQELVRRLETYFAQGGRNVQSSEGEEFIFMRAISFILPTACRAHTLSEFASYLQKVSIHSIAHHVFEARLHKSDRSSDFSLWLEGELGEKDLAEAIDRIDPYTHTLEGLRRSILKRIEERLKTEKKEEAPA